LAVVEAAADRAHALDNRRAEALARAAAARRRVLVGTTGATVDEQEALAREAIDLFQQAEDDEGLVRAWVLLGGAGSYRGQYEDYALACERALQHARRIGRPGLLELPGALVFGPRPADEALRTLDTLIADEPHPWARLSRAELLAMLGKFDEARAIGHEANHQLLERTGDEGGEQLLGRIAMLAGDDETAARYLRVDCDRLQARKQFAVLSTYAPMLGRTLSRLGRYDEAEEWVQLGRELGDETDVLTQALWRQAQALVLSSRAEYDEAIRLAREAVAAAEQTDSLNTQGDALCDLAEVLERAGQAQEAAAVLDIAVERYERKRNWAMATRVREKLATFTVLPG
jgi:tetratricopeptide (TPR) repeat protein